LIFGFVTNCGTCVKRITRIDRSNTIQIGLSVLPAGYYVLRVTSDEFVVVKKLVIADW
jgi:hypothetical protein